MRVEVYRLLLFSLRDVLERRLGPEKTSEFLFEAGSIAGWEFAEHMLSDVTVFSHFITRLQSVCREMGIGLVEVEQAETGRQDYYVTVTEDLDCSGVPDINRTICQFDEGFISALLEYATEQKYTVREVECWAAGARVCRFLVRKIN